MAFPYLSHVQPGDPSPTDAQQSTMGAIFWVASLRVPHPYTVCTGIEVVLETKALRVGCAPRHFWLGFVGTRVGIATEKKRLAGRYYRTQKLLDELAELRSSNHRIGHPDVQVHVDDSYARTVSISAAHRMRVHCKTKDTTLPQAIQITVRIEERQLALGARNRGVSPPPLI